MTSGMETFAPAHASQGKPGRMRLARGLQTTARPDAMQQEDTMNLHRQLLRAIAMLAFIGVAGAATLVAPAPPECPLAKAAKPQRILLLDPMQHHPSWIDARVAAPPARTRLAGSPS
jgi:hypothetical protein